MIFIFQFVTVVYYIDFVDIKESLHSWDKAHLVMVYDFFNMYCWILFARILLRIFASMFISGIGLWFSSFFFVCVASLSGFGIRVMVAS